MFDERGKIKKKFEMSAYVTQEAYLGSTAIDD